MHKSIQENRSQIVGIVGASCTGKTWLAQQICQRLGKEAVNVSLDSFYLDRSHLSPARRALLNFDHPGAIDWPRVEQMLRNCDARKTFSVPGYDFATHARHSQDSILKAAPVVVVDGLWLFRRPQIRDLFSLKVFIRAPQYLCVERRIARDTRERGRTIEQVRAQLERYTLPMSKRFVTPQEKWADVILQTPVSAQELSQLMNRIAENLRPAGI